MRLGLVALDQPVGPRFLPFDNDGAAVVGILAGVRAAPLAVERREILAHGDRERLAPGDTIYVHRAPMIYVGGEVNKAGAYRLEPHMTVMQAIALGGGINPRGTERGIRIHRKNGNGEVKKIDARMTDLVRADDVIYVRESLF